MPQLSQRIVHLLVLLSRSRSLLGGSREDWRPAAVFRAPLVGSFTTYIVRLFTPRLKVELTPRDVLRKADPGLKGLRLLGGAIRVDPPSNTQWHQSGPAQWRAWTHSPPATLASFGNLAQLA